jgi:hypothetical protein
MHEIIKRYLGKTRFINDTTLFLYRKSPHRLREAAVYSLYELRKSRLPDTKFLIFAQGRSGSTLMVDLMNSHPDVLSLGEILQNNVITNVRNPRKFAEGLCTLSKKPACGFKVKVYQLEGAQRKDPAVVLADFHQHGWKIIYLVRRNLLRHAISDIRSEKTGQFHNVQKSDGDRSTTGKRSKIHVTIEELMQAIQFRVDCISKEERALKPLPHLTIEYEKDLLDPDAQRDAMNRIFAYLNLPPHDAETSFRKVTSKNIADDVENFDELERALKKTEHAQYLGWG